MGSYVSQMLSNYYNLFAKKEHKALIVGLDAAGKTTMLYRMKLNEAVTTIPTIGFNVETLQVGKFHITTWDVGGRDKIRALYKHYYANLDMLIFVVDSNDRERISEATDELHKALSDDQLRDVRVLVLANKQDLPNAMCASEVTEKLKLHTLRQNWYIQGCCATTGEGLWEGFDYLLNKMPQSTA